MTNHEMYLWFKGHLKGILEAHFLNALSQVYSIYLKLKQEPIWPMILARIRKPDNILQC